MEEYISKYLVLPPRTEAEVRARRLWSGIVHGPECTPPDKFHRGGYCVCEFEQRVDAMYCPDNGMPRHD